MNSTKWVPLIACIRALHLAALTRCPRFIYLMFSWCCALHNHSKQKTGESFILLAQPAGSTKLHNFLLSSSFLTKKKQTCPAEFSCQQTAGMLTVFCCSYPQGKLIFFFLNALYSVLSAFSMPMFISGILGIHVHEAIKSSLSLIALQTITFFSQIRLKVVEMLHKRALI